MVSLGNLTLFSEVVEGAGLVAVADATDAVAVEGLRASYTGIDLIGPLPVTNDENKYILTLSDYCTKWVEAVPLESKEATGIATALFKVIYYKSYARYIVCMCIQ